MEENEGNCPALFFPGRDAVSGGVFLLIEIDPVSCLATK
jgi:hypothetical protein